MRGTFTQIVALQGTFNFSLLEPLMAVSDQDEGEDEA
jgi:hypothetical protein